MLLWANVDLKGMCAARPGVRGRSALLQLQTELTVHIVKDILHMKLCTIKTGRIKIPAQVSFSSAIFMNRNQ
jgi:hypothetical protein